jgi:hypothetical protein
MTRITGTLHEELGTFMILFRWILLTMRNLSDKIASKIKTHILCSMTLFRKLCRLWNRPNVEKYDRAGQATDGNIIRHMVFACWITKATDIDSEYVILISFPRKKWLRKLASILRYTYIASLVISHFGLCLPRSWNRSLVAGYQHLRVYTRSLNIVT